jgi:hypothetical protein
MEGPGRGVPETARLTAYRPERGASDLYSVFVRFAARGDEARIYASIEAMVERLPKVGEILVLTDGHQMIAECNIIDENYDDDV